MIVEARQKLEGPRGRCLHRIHVLIVGGGHAATAAVEAAAASAATSGTSVTSGTDRVTTSIINAVATTAIDGSADAAADPVANLLSLHQCRYLLSL